MSPGPENHWRQTRENRITELAGAYAEAILAGDEVAAEITIREAMDSSLSTAEIDEKVIAPALWLVGDLWERGKISVGEEHIATEITVRVLALQREAQRVAESRRSRRVLLATATGELHVVALRMVANLLRGAGYDIVMAGPDMPPRTLAAAARRHRAEVICMSSTMPGRRGELLEAIEEVRRAWPSAAFVLGGRGLTAEEQVRPQVQICRGVSEAIEAVDAAVKHARLN